MKSCKSSVFDQRILQAARELTDDKLLTEKDAPGGTLRKEGAAVIFGFGEFLRRI